MTSILEQEYMEPDRPFSQRELQYARTKLFRTLRIGSTRANHNQCRHFYFVKEHGRKEKEIKDAKSEDIGNCSVCWKFNKTPRHLKVIARSLTDDYCKRFFEPQKYLTHDGVDLESTFYKWLYEEMN
jgi:hypothetical protein